MAALLNNLIDKIGDLSIGVFTTLILTFTVGHFLEVKQSTLWRKIVAYIGNVNTNIDIEPNEGPQKKKTIEA